MQAQALSLENVQPDGAGSFRSLKAARALTPALIESAQACYDAWDESDFETYAGGGICHLIAEAMAEVLVSADIEAETICSSFEQHVYVVCRLKDGVYTLDIPHGLYEVGAMFTWRKLEGVVFDASSLEWFCVDTDPSRYAEYRE